MLEIALKMLLGDKVKHLGIVMALTFASLIINQQASIFLGLMSRTYSLISDSGEADVWVMKKSVKFIDDVKPLYDSTLYRVRSVQGVKWAVPFLKSQAALKLPDGNEQSVTLIGVDDVSLVGVPPKFSEGKKGNLHVPNVIFIDVDAQNDKLMCGQKLLSLGSEIEINSKKALVGGVVEVSKTFQTKPTIYTTISRASSFLPPKAKNISYILVKKDNDVSLESVKENINKISGLKALSKNEFISLTWYYFMQNTGIPVNFGIVVLLGFIIGIAIAGQTFYNFTHDNLVYYGTLKAMGATMSQLTRMAVFQALYLGCVGYGLGVGLTAIFGFLISSTSLSFNMPLWLLFMSFVMILCISIISCVISIRTIKNLDVHSVFK